MTIAKWKEDTPTDPRKYMSTTCVTHEHETPAHKAHRGLRTRSQGELRAKDWWSRGGSNPCRIANATLSQLSNGPIRRGGGVYGWRRRRCQGDSRRSDGRHRFRMSAYTNRFCVGADGCWSVS